PFAGRHQNDGFTRKQSFEKQRKLDLPYADLEPFLINELDSIMGRHIHGLTTRAEYARIFGKNEGKLNKMVRDFAKEYSALPRSDKSVTLNEAIDEIYALADRLQGIKLSTGNISVDRGIQHAKNASVMIHLGLVTLASLSETFSPAMRGGIGQFSKSMVKALGDAAVETSSTISKMATGKRIFPRTHLREQAELFDAVSQNALVSVMHQRFGSSTSKMTSIFIRATGLEQLTNFQRIIAFDMAQANVKNYAKKLAKGAKGRLKKQLEMELKDMGIDPTAAIKWHNDGAKTEGAFWYNVLMGAQRFTQQVITSPNEATLPKIMQSPMWSAVFQFKSFISVFSNTFLKGVIQNGRRAETLEAQFRPLAPMVMMVGTAFFVQFFRE
ncbi:MAG: hypothetical protein R8M45_07500, partial [Ghiorsea sp.]